MSNEQLVSAILDSFEDDEYFSDRSGFIKEYLENTLANLDYIKEKNPDGYDFYQYVKAKSTQSISDNDFYKYILKPLAKNNILKLKDVGIADRTFGHISSTDHSLGDFIGRYRANLSKFKVSLP